MSKLCTTNAVALGFGNGKTAAAVVHLADTRLAGNPTLANVVAKFSAGAGIRPFRANVARRSVPSRCQNLLCRRATLCIMSASAATFRRGGGLAGWPR